MVTDDKFLLLKMHAVSQGLSDDAVREIADACELVRIDSGDVLHRANDPFDSIYLLLYGRVRQSLIDIQGNILMQRYQTRDGQIGALAAALGEPSPIEVVAEEPTTLLKLPYDQAMRMTKQHDAFRQNFSRIVADSVQKLVMKERRQKKPTLVAICHQSPATRELTKRLIVRLQELGEVPHLMSDQADWQPLPDVPYFSLKDKDGYCSGAAVLDQLDQWSHSKRVFVDIDAAVDPTRLGNLVEVIEKVFFCVSPSNWQQTVERLQVIEQRAPNWRDKINIVWLLDEQNPVAPSAPELGRLAKRDFKVTFDEPSANQSRELINGLERIIHQLRGIRIGLALGGGAAKGMAHLGVLKTLADQGIVIDMIAGTSAGAMTGILYASGMGADYTTKRFVEDLTPPWLFRHLPNGAEWDLLYKYRRRRFDPMLRKYLGESRLEQLAIPVRSITVDLVSGTYIVRDQGDAVHAITESINLPVLAAPINRDGKSLVDGGVVNNVPADVLVKNGCNFVIAVSVTSKLQPEFARNQATTPTAKMRSASVLQTIMRTFLVQSVNLNSIGVQPADFVIEPDVSKFDVTAFTRAAEMAAIGKAAALEATPKIKEILARLDPQLFAAHG